ncbi:MAG: His-Xaa-Ser system radical SAM maturase HxsC [Bacteroidota bacterium]
MIFRAKGKAVGITDFEVGRITRDSGALESNLIYISSQPYITPQGAIAIISNDIEKKPTPHDIGQIYACSSLDHLSEGDVVMADNNGVVRTLYRVNSHHNTILSTERCNSNCLMCSQPPRDRDDVPALFEIYKRAIPLIPKDCIELTISGGEPTLMGERFFELLELITQELPDTEIHILTNGRSFAWNHMAERLSRIQNQRIMLGIPLYSDYNDNHDYIVQAKDAFNQTILGLHNLARYGIRVEIRVVLHKASIPRLPKLSAYIYRNLPFAEHVTFMGLEFIGYTPFNIEKLWIDPMDYTSELTKAVEYLSYRDMNVSIYNTQLCTVPEKLWPYCRKSISDWKNDYLPACQSCDKLQDCGGLFTWNLKKHSRGISPISKDKKLSHQIC